MKFSLLYKFCPVCGSSRFMDNNFKSKRCEDCGFVMYVNASASVAAFITNESGDLLVCKRGKEPAKGTWDLAGGFVDDAESAEQALVREIYEELGSEVIKYRYLFSLPNEYEYSGLTVPTMDLFFSCNLKNNEGLVPADDVEDCFFVPMSEVKPENFGLRSVSKAVGIYLEKDLSNS